MPRHIPNFYRPMFPGGPRGPLRWQDDQSNILPDAVYAFFDVPGFPPVTSEQLELVREYAEYYINAPCWITDDQPERWVELRASIKAVKTKQAMIAWLHEALEVTIDPF